MGVNEERPDKKTSGAARRKRRKAAQRHAPGTSPGTITVSASAQRPVIEAIAFGPGEYAKHQGLSPEAAHALVGTHPVVWINVTGLGDAKIIEQVGDLFRLHRLALEDAVHTHQRPKIEEYPDRLFIVFRAPEPPERGAAPAPEPGQVGTEQIAMFLGPGFVLTFQEGHADCFEPVRVRARGGKGRMRNQGPDYLAYALLDAATDAFFPVLDSMRDRIDAIEQDIHAHAPKDAIARIYEIRHDLANLRRAIWPLRDVLNALVRDPSTLIGPEARVFLRDCYDHTAQLMDLVEGCRDSTSGLMDLHLGMASARMNEVMKVLTVIATLFMPLTFIVGVYGMNFDRASPLNMPELGWSYGYLFALGLCAISTLILFIYFRRKGWLGGR